MKETPISTSQFRFLWVTLVFAREPLWYRLIVIVLCMAVTLAIIFSLREWSAPAMVAGQYFTMKVGVGSGLVRRLEGM